MGAFDIQETTIYGEQLLRSPAWWPAPLADQWRSLYPALFSEHDLEMAHNQPRNHFFEWFAAIHRFQCDRSLALVEKYAYPIAHPEKFAVYSSVFSKDERRELDAIRKEFGNKQLPDLLVLGPPDYKRPYFVEVKGVDPVTKLRDELTQDQKSCFQAIRDRLGIRIEALKVVLVDLKEVSRDAGILET
jgi:hypothetical protein